MKCMFCKKKDVDLHEVSSEDKICINCFQEIFEEQKKNLKFFDSVAEQKAFVYLKIFCKKNNYFLAMQEEIMDTKKGCKYLDKHEEYICFKNCEYPSKFCYGCEYKYINTFVRYVLDFIIITNNDEKINIEIDGKQWHNKYEDSERDYFMIHKKGFKCVIRIKAKQVLYYPTGIIDTVERRIEREYY